MSSDTRNRHAVGMGRYWLLAGALLAFFLVAFLAAEALGVPLLTDPAPYLTASGPAALIGVGLLLVDVLLPVPSSVVMTAHGALFGVLPGTLLSLVGSTGAALVAFGLGRAGAPVIARIVTPEAHERASRALRRWGPMAVVITRPLPLLAETVAVLAGTSRLTWGQMAVAAAAGSLPSAMLYAVIGAALIEGLSMAWAFLAVAGIAGMFWWAGTRIGRGEGPPSRERGSE